MTSQPEIRNVPVDDMLPWLRTMRTALLVDPGGTTEAALDWWRTVWQPERIIGAYHGGRCVGTLRTFASTLTVPSGAGDCAEIPIDALTQVGVAGTHRRRGLLTGMLSRSLQAARDRGEVASLLRAAEWPIYGRFGYQPTSFGSNYQIRSSPGLTIRKPAAPVEVVQVEPAELIEHAIAVHGRVRRQRAGQLDRDRPTWLRRLGLEGHRPAGSREPVCVIARSADGSVDGYATWAANDGDWFHDYHDQAQAQVTEALAATPDAYLAIWQYLIGLDLIRVLTLDAYPVDEPLEWLLSDGRAARRTWTGDNDWLRLLDVPAALSARRYPVTDRLVLDVIDTDAGGWAHGKVELDGGPGHAECRQATAATPDLSLSQRGLAAIYLGGCTASSQQLAGLIDEHTPGALARLQAMFASSPAPWNATPF